MRVFTNGRGAHPEIDSSCIHAWTFDESSATGTANDIYGGYNLSTVTGTPVLRTDSDIGFAARGMTGTQALSGALNGNDAGVTNETIIGSMRLTANGSAKWLVLYCATALPSVTFGMYLDAGNKLSFYWESSGGASIITNSAIALPLNKWIHFAVTRAVSGTTTLKLFLWGSLAETFTGITNARTTAASQRWIVCGDNVLANNGVADWSSLFVYNATKTNAQVEDQLRRMMLFPFETWCPVRVQVGDKTGALVDVSQDLPGTDYLSSAQYKDDVDSTIMTATVTLAHASGGYSLARYHDNALNRYPLPSAAAPGPASTTYVAPGTGTVTEMLALDRPIVISSCRLPLGVQPTSTDWQEVFNGYITDYNSDGDVITIDCADQGQRVKAPHVMTDEVYGDDVTGVLLETAMQSILTAAADAAKVPRWGLQTGWPRTTTAPTLSLGWTDGSMMPAASPAWALRKWKQTRQPVLDALNTLAEQIGYKCRYRWVGNAWKLQLYEPPRQRTFADMVLTDFDVRKLGAMKISMANIRTMVRVCYYSRETASPTVPTIASGTNPAKTVGAMSAWNPAVAGGGVVRDQQDYILNPASLVIYASDLDASELGSSAVTEYGIIPCEIAESAGANIDTVVEAQRLGVALLRDLCFPKADVSASFGGIPELELHDNIRLRANSLWATADLDLAVTGFSESWGNSSEETNIQMRGAPCGGSDTHLAKITTAGSNPPAADPYLADIDVPRRIKRGILADQVKNSQLHRENLRTLMRNADFSRRTFGGRPPDCWRMAAGTWESDAFVNTTTYDSGTQSLQIKTNSASVQSDPCPCNDTNPIQFESRHLCDVAAITARVNLEWLTGTGGSLGVTNIIAHLPAALSTWYTRRVTIAPPATARFFRLSLARTGAGVGYAFFDRVQAVPQKPSFLAVGAGVASANKTVTLVDFATETYDWGNNYLNTAGNYAFTAPEEGWYEFTGYVHQTVAAGTVSTQVMIYKNAAMLMCSTPGAQGLDLSGATHNRATVMGMTYLAPGDVITCRVYNDNNTGAPGAATVQSDSFFSGRLVAVE